MATQENWIDFQEVKRAVSMEMVLQKYGVQLRRVNQRYLRGNCPLPTHGSDTKNSFTVHTEKNVWNCKSDSCVAGRNGKKGGNVLDLVAQMEKCTVRDAALKLTDWFDIGKRTKGERRDLAISEPLVNMPLAFRLKDVNPKHPYITLRGISLVTAEEFEVGYFPGKGSMVGRVVIPIHNEHGELVAYVGRAPSGILPKYLFPIKFNQKLEIFNLHRIKGSEVILCKGFFPCMKLWQGGYAAVASMSSSISDAQAELLSRFANVTIFMDGDEAGRKAAPEIAAKLLSRTAVRIVDCPDGKQPDHLSAAEVEAILMRTY